VQLEWQRIGLGNVDPVNVNPQPDEKNNVSGADVRKVALGLLSQGKGAPYAVRLRPIRALSNYPAVKAAALPLVGFSGARCS
jgi:hypothetical protein